MIPIIFVHYGDVGYLEYTFRMAVKFNPEIDIYLLGDDMNRHYERIGIHHEFYDKYLYGELWDKFTEIFECISTFEDKAKFTIAFYRWFILHNFVAEKQIERCWFFDSDTLIRCDLSQKIERFSTFLLSLTNYISCCSCFINDQSIIEKYIKLIIELYEDIDFINNQRQITSDHIAKGTFYTLSVMTIFREYQKRYGPLGETSAIIDAESFDPNINLDRADQIETEPVWEMDTSILGPTRPIKKLYFIKGVPYCYHLGQRRVIKMNTLNMSWIPTGYIRNVFTEMMKDENDSHNIYSLW